MLFKGRIEIQAVASLFFFKKKGIVQKLMHALKYRGREEIGIYFGRILGREMGESRRFQSVDLVIPVPLHPRKKRTRGYNQVSGFGRSLAETLGVEYREGILTRMTHGRSQTGKDRLSRNLILMNSFKLNEFNKLRNKHILIVDDIITSGSTLEACARLIQEVPGTRVSLASLSFTL